MQAHPNGRDRLNCFALVAYIPDPLGKFLDDLRRELVPGCVPHAHVTILPPRPLSSAVDGAIPILRGLASDFPPFEIEAVSIEVFPVTDVVYVEVGIGGAQLHQMHDVMNSGPAGFHEPFDYHPHITLAQELTRDRSVECAAIARRRWAEFPHSRRFTADKLWFVQNTVDNRWIDLAQFSLAAVPVR
ncbi:MAG: 2'-5' RNA ligase family protein [Bryobacteraceae bacterium]